MAVVGTDHADLERRVGQADEAEPGGRDQEMDIRPFVIHVLDAVLGLIVLHARPRHLAAHPFCLTAGEGLARRGLAENPPVVFRTDAIVVETGHTSDRPFSDGEAVGLQFGETRPEARIDIAL